MKKQRKTPTQPVNPAPVTEPGVYESFDDSLDSSRNDDEAKVDLVITRNRAKLAVNGVVIPTGSALIRVVDRLDAKGVYHTKDRAAEEIAADDGTYPVLFQGRKPDATDPRAVRESRQTMIVEVGPVVAKGVVKYSSAPDRKHVATYAEDGSLRWWAVAHKREIENAKKAGLDLRA